MKNLQDIIYFKGYTEGAKDSTEVHNIIWFGAIRRAATYARQMDAKAETLTFDDRWECTDFAKGARAAIRAAIGSEKSH